VALLTTSRFLVLAGLRNQIFFSFNHFRKSATIPICSGDSRKLRLTLFRGRWMGIA
jgi:hypothetical protein